MQQICMDKFVLSVFELNTYVSDRMYQDPFLEEVWIQGEIGDFNLSHGTAYFVLSDGQASVDCMIFDYADTLYADMALEGQAVMLSGDISIYRKNGRFRIVVDSIQLTGLGELYERFNRLRERLEEKGVFAEGRKRKIPGYPRKIGIVTSRQGAAIQDIINIVRRRNPLVKMVLYPVKVQGADAPGEIVEGIRYFNSSSDADVLIVGRGGGAAEDLFAFNDERVVMEIYNSRIPVISAVGHESDYTLADMAADMRAPTPSAAAELAVPVKDDIAEKLGDLRMKLESSMGSIFFKYENEVAQSRNMISDVSMRSRLSGAGKEIETLKTDMKHYTDMLYKNILMGYNTYNAKLAGLNPEETFVRGYSVITKDGKTVKSVSELKKGDDIGIILKDGEAKAVVEEVGIRND